MVVAGMFGISNGFHNGSPESAPHDERSNNVNQQSYALTGQAMLVALLLLFSVVVLFLLLHIYARCLLLLHRRSVLLRRSRGFLHDPDNPTSSSAAARGLDASVLASLPVFVFSAETHRTQMLDCAVCLSEFEENEKGRLLPKCNHSFHIDCIDMWFHSHSTCPLCRATVLPESPTDPLPLSAIRVDENPELDSGSGFCSSCRVEGETEPSSSSSSSLSGGAASSIRMKGLEIAVGTSRGESLRGSEGVEIAAVSPGKLKSPGSRILSLKRMFSGDRRAGAFSTSGSSSFAEADLERGEAQS